VNYSSLLLPPPLDTTGKVIPIVAESINWVSDAESLAADPGLGTLVENPPPLGRTYHVTWLREDAILESLLEASPPSNVCW
jgi:hypothetical protein